MTRPWRIGLAIAYLGNYVSPIGSRPVFLAKLVPEHVYDPALVRLSRMYLARDFCVALAVLTFTVWVAGSRRRTRTLVSDSQPA